MSAVEAAHAGAHESIRRSPPPHRRSRSDPHLRRPRAPSPRRRDCSRSGTDRTLAGNSPTSPSNCSRRASTGTAIDAIVAGSAATDRDWCGSARRAGRRWPGRRTTHPRIRRRVPEQHRIQRIAVGGASGGHESPIERIRDAERQRPGNRHRLPPRLVFELQPGPARHFDDDVEDVGVGERRNVCEVHGPTIAQDAAGLRRRRSSSSVRNCSRGTPSRI